MFTNISIGKYIYRDSTIHKIHPIIKIILLILVLIFSLTSNVLENICLFLSIIIICYMTKIDLKTHLKNIYGIRFLIISIIIINLIFKVDYIIIINSILKLIITIIYTGVFLYTTTINEINYSLNILMSPLKKIKIDSNKISLILSISIKFISVVTDELNNVLKAYKSRGLNFKGNILIKIEKIKTFLVTLFYLLIKKTENISDLFEIRNYNINKLNINKKQKLKLIDYTFLLINIMLIFIIKVVL